MTLMALSFAAIPTQNAWVGLKTVPSATSPDTNGQPRLPASAELEEALPPTMAPAPSASRARPTGR